MKPIISVIVAVRNGAQTLERCIASFVDQTLPEKELIVIDGQSTDGTQEILRKHEKDISYWVSEKDSGIYDAWNKGVAVSSGTWITFLGADDWFWSPDVLLRFLPEFSRAKENGVSVVYASIAKVDNRRRLIATRGIPWETAGAAFQTRMSIPHPGLMHHRSLFLKHGAFDISFQISGDYDFLLRELKRGEAHFVDGLVSVAIGNDGISNRPDMQHVGIAELQKIRERHGLKPSRNLSSAAGRLRSALSVLIYRIFGERIFRAIRSWYWAAVRAYRQRKS